eukprot:CAMPEP_0201506768 /NCGR_PEP_ID=MMETSP0161_2-20130828/624_1 /ASSEMBLY_ACC=CAM_ASM_000251 /TAXON_ID=180227 /ORGANISM="Neoparamoeba aestuarina, Strain SoJaBio B1-5/56/2" /LENGTH=64 /DNA_ID=CAMNT_0047900951 /DNA_START=69 /DNA_END=263 /DNA_ORIENTATION=-
MTRGDQRDRDRARAQARAKKAGANKKNDKSGHGAQNLTNKKEAEADVMRRKQEAANAKKAAQGK